MIARVAALLEIDAKKIVALSTLRQLGLIFFSIALGNMSLCLFHVITHALAKANLFLIVGNLLHIKFSQQDARYISSGSIIRVMNLMRVFIRVLSLSGVLFTSGFFSKELILSKHSFVINRGISWGLLLILTTLTLAYCIKITSIVLLNNNPLETHSRASLYSRAPSLLLRSLSVIGGYLLFENLFLRGISLLRTPMVYVFLVVLFGLVLRLNIKEKILITLQGFLFQLKAIDGLLKIQEGLKKSSFGLEASFTEVFYLI